MWLCGILGLKDRFIILPCLLMHPHMHTYKQERWRSHTSICTYPFNKHTGTVMHVHAHTPPHGLVEGSRKIYHQSAAGGAG